MQKHSDEENARYRAIVSSLSECIKVVDENCNLVEMNRKGLDLIGSENLAQVKGISVLELLLPQYRESFELGVKKVFKGETVEQEFEILSLDGTKRWMHQIAVPYYDPNQPGIVKEMVAVTRDVTRLKSTEEELKETALRLNESVKAGGIGLWEWDLQSDALTWDDRMYQIFGITDQSLKITYELWESLLHPQDKSFVIEAIKSAINSRKEYDLEFRVVCPSGVTRWIKGNATIIRNDAGNALRMVGTSQDITRTKEQEQQLLNTQKVVLAGQLSAGICHDLNNVLSIISGNAELIELRQGAGDVSKFSRKILDGIARAKSVTDRLLKLAKPKEENLTSIRLDDVVSGELRFYQEALPNSIEISTSLESNATIRIDSNTLTDSIINLIVNAQKATNDNGRIEISTFTQPFFSPSSEYVYCRPREAREYAVLSIKDNGKGIEPHHLNDIFTPFFSERHSTGGSGLGLAVVSAFAINNQCGLTVSSQVGQGTEFKLWLPTSEDESTCEVTPETLSMTPIKGKMIVLVEDEKELLDATLESLELCGAEVRGFTDPEKALRFIEQNAQTVDILLTDQSLGVPMSGSELVKLVVTDYPHIRCVVMTGYSADDRFSGLPAKIIEKPAPLNLMIEVLSKAGY